jgi:hypothetical protein
MEIVVSHLVSLASGRSRRELICGLAVGSRRNGRRCPRGPRFQRREHRPCQHSCRGPAAVSRFLSEDVRFLCGQSGSGGRHNPPRQHQGARLSQPWRPRGHRRPLCHRGSAIRQGIRRALFDAARRQSSAGRLCWFAHQGSRRDKRTKFSEGLTNERAA